MGSLDKFYGNLKRIRDRICSTGVPEILEVCRDDLAQIGRAILICLLDDRKDIIPSGSWMSFNSNDCLALGRRVMEQLFKMKVAINESSNLNLRGQIKVFYSGGREWMCELK